MPGSDPPRVASTTPIEWIEASIRKHNEYRTMHGVPPLVYNEKLSEISQAYANQLAKTFKFDHNPVLNDAELGENLYYRTSSVAFDLEPEIAVTEWYNEIQDYDFKTGEAVEDNKEILHFTQLVWKGTSDVGVAFAKGIKPDGKHIIYAVANYSPRGNWDDFLVNVPIMVEKRVATPAEPEASKCEEKSAEVCGRSPSIGFVLLGGFAAILAGILAFYYLKWK